MTEYCIFLDPERRPEHGTFRTMWKDMYANRKDLDARWALDREVRLWLLESFGSNWPEDRSRGRWTGFVNCCWQIHDPADAILFKLRWCQPVSWFTPGKWSLEREEARRKAWEGYDGYQW